jgi:uncharacterized iron-regulated protein
MILKRFLFVVAIMAALLSGISLASTGQDVKDKSQLLKIGDPRFRDKVLDILPGELYSAETGKTLPFAKMIQEMRGSQIIYVGETHNSLPMHDLQFKVVQALYEQDPNIAIGLEMLPVAFQDILNKWSLGILSEEEFIGEARWYVNWNFNFGFYEKIFSFTKAHKIPMIALNVPREIITKIRISGWEALGDEEKTLVPKPDLSHEEHRLLIRTIFETTEIPHQMKGAGLDMMFEGLYRSQTAWDEVMAANALEGLRKERKKMIVLAGSGHLLYNLGINMRAFQKSKLPFKTVVSVVIPEGEKAVAIARSLADYVYGMAEETRPAYPSVGLGFKKFKGLENLVIDNKPIDGVAEGADFEKGDVVLGVDDTLYTDINELRKYLAKFTWDDEVKFRLLHNAQEKEVVLKFTMKPPAPAEIK